MLRPISFIALGLLLQTWSACIFEEGKFALIEPHENETVLPCCVNFEWEDIGADEYHILVSVNPEFDSLVLDTTTTEPNFPKGYTFQPGRTFFWKVTSPKKESDIGQFQTQNVVDYYEGTYPVSIFGYLESPLDPQYGETTYVSSLTLIGEGLEKIRVTEPSSGLDYSMPYSYDQEYPGYYFAKEDCSLFLLYHAGLWDRLYFNSTNDSIFVFHSTGGVHGGHRWEMRGRKE